MGIFVVFLLGSALVTSIFHLFFVVYFRLLGSTPCFAFSLARGELDALFLRHRLLITNFGRVQRVFREFTVKSSHATNTLHLIYLLRWLTLHLWLVLVLNGHAVDRVQLMQVPDATFD